MKPENLIEIMKTINHLKDTTRHSWTKQGRHESVAEHTYSLACMAFLMKDEFPDADFYKVLSMCLFHDIGEAFTGDIPAFEKEKSDEVIEQNCVGTWLKTLPEPLQATLTALFEEMEALETLEAKIYKALDKMDALLMHNEADISTWLPLEYELNQTYGNEQVAFSSYLKEFRKAILMDTLEKIDAQKSMKKRHEIHLMKEVLRPFEKHCYAGI